MNDLPHTHLPRLWPKGNLIIFFFSALLLSACSTENLNVTQEQATVDYKLLLTLPEKDISWNDEVRPVLERRCVVCHGCYDAPCQLKISSFEGLQRGANKQKIYDGTRIFGAEPTRLGIDAKTTSEWRTKGFHPVLNETENTPDQNLKQSLLYQLLRLKQLHPQPRVGMLPDSFDLGLDRKQVCPEPDQFKDYAIQHPLWGMPYAMPNLQDKEYNTLMQWLAQGSPVPPATAPSRQAATEIIAWEKFFNADSNKQKLVNRYLYEHLFRAHIHFSGTPDREFYRLVRSTTPPGQPVDEIATVRPYDDPGSIPFYFRLSPYQWSIVAKDHIVYELSPARMQRFRELFLEPEYLVNELPSHEAAIASNPFRVFEPIPLNARYRFMLDDARFFIEGFIKGPVCRGQIALNVIEDHFWVFFFNPDHKMFSTDAAFLDPLFNDLEMPNKKGNTLKILSARTDYWHRLTRYMKAKQAWFKNIQARNLDEAMDFIWDGDGENHNAALTIFRHFDSASVTPGLVGDYPETAWVIDYPLFERIHYLLVAGFDVYGNVGHQLGTRLYMDFLRMEGEDHFLAFLPVSDRKKIRDSWYTGLREGLHERPETPTVWLDVESVVGYQTDDPQKELYHHLEKRLSKMAGEPDHLNRCSTEPCQHHEQNNSVEAAKPAADRAMAKIATIQGRMLSIFPDLAFVRIHSDDNSKPEIAYTLILNKAYLNLTSILENEDRRDLEHDTLSVVEGLVGSYPNFFFDIEHSQAEEFARRYMAINSRADYEQFVSLFGMRRTDTRFWELADWFQDYYAEQQPRLSGLLDLNRYRNR